LIHASRNRCGSAGHLLDQGLLAEGNRVLAVHDLLAREAGSGPFRRWCSVPRLPIIYIMGTIVKRPSTLSIESSGPLIRQWLTSGRRRSEHTRRAYLNDMELLGAWLGVRLEEVPWSAEATAVFLTTRPAADRASTSAQLDTWQTDLRDAGERPSTINRRLATVASFSHWAVRKGLMAFQLAPDAYERAEPLHRPPISWQDVEAMLRAAKNTKERLVVRLLWDLGLRRSELADLQLEDVDVARRTLMVLSKRRTTKEPTPMPEPTIGALATWLRERGTEPGSLLGLAPRSIGAVVQRCGERAGLGKVSPHRLRHGHLTAGLDLGLDMHAGAASLRSTVSNLQRYDDKRFDRAAEFRKRVATLVTLERE
jgi:integrase/recombinase XerC